MTVLDRLASALNRADEVPNQVLARELVANLTSGRPERPDFATDADTTALQSAGITLVDNSTGSISDFSAAGEVAAETAGSTEDGTSAGAAVTDTSAFVPRDFDGGGPDHDGASLALTLPFVVRNLGIMLSVVLVVAAIQTSLRRLKRHRRAVAAVS